MSRFRILSIDGGGLRGIVPLLILEELEKRTGKRVHELFDLISGTSTGGLIACCLTIRDERDPTKPKYSVSELKKMYTENGETIFPPASKLGSFFKKANNLVNPQFGAKGLDKVLRMFIADQRIKNSLLPIIVSTYDLEGNQPVFFKTSEAQENEFANALIYDICRATSAAPTYLPAHSFTYKEKSHTCIDGGVYINNPTMAALAEIIKYKGMSFYNKPDLRLEDISILSLGTGTYTGSITKEQAVSWGQLQWVTRITDIMMKGVNQTTDYEAKQMACLGKYLRLDVKIHEEQFSDMTDSRPKTREYLVNETFSQIINEPEKTRLLNDFCSQLQLQVESLV